MKINIFFVRKHNSQERNEAKKLNIDEERECAKNDVAVIYVLRDATSPNSVTVK